MEGYKPWACLDRGLAQHRIIPGIECSRSSRCPRRKQRFADLGSRDSAGSSPATTKSVRAELCKTHPRGHADKTHESIPSHSCRMRRLDPACSFFLELAQSTAIEFRTTSYRGVLFFSEEPGYVGYSVGGDEPVYMPTGIKFSCVATTNRKCIEKCTCVRVHFVEAVLVACLNNDTMRYNQKYERRHWKTR